MCGNWSRKVAGVHQSGFVDVFYQLPDSGAARRGQGGVRAGNRFDFVTTLLVLIGYAIPGFVLGVALLVIFGGQLQWFEAKGGLTRQTGKP